MNRFSREALQSYFEQWDRVKEDIEELYERKDSSVITHMKKSLHNYMCLLEYGGYEEIEQGGQGTYRLLPLNGHERIAFIEKQIHSAYAFAQLTALFDETRKKAARLHVMEKNKM